LGHPRKKELERRAPEIREKEISKVLSLMTPQPMGFTTKGCDVFKKLTRTEAKYTVRVSKRGFLVV